MTWRGLWAGALGVLAAALAGPAGAAERLLTLDEALRTAEAHEPQLLAARAQLRAARARSGEAFAGFLPRLDVQGQYQRTTANFTLTPSIVRSPFASALKIDNSLDTVNYFLFGANLGQTLYDFGRTGGGYEQAREAARAAGADLGATEESISLAVRVAYFGVLAAKELVLVGAEQVKNQEKHVTQIREFVRAGTRPKIDLTSAELNLANAELALVRARNGYDLARVQLYATMGVEGPSDFDVAAPPVVAEPEEGQAVDALLPSALAARPEMVRIEAQRRAEEAVRRIARSGWFPALTANANVAGTQVDRFDVGVNAYVGVALSWNLFAGDLTEKQLEEADALLAALEAQRRGVRLQIRSDLEQQLLSVDEAKRRLEVAERAQSTAQERLRLAEGRYQAGAGDILELDDAQVTLTNAQAQKVQANYDLAIARARLLRAMGRR